MACLVVGLNVVGPPSRLIEPDRIAPGLLERVYGISSVILVGKLVGMAYQRGRSRRTSLRRFTTALFALVLSIMSEITLTGINAPLRMPALASSRYLATSSPNSVAID